MTLNTVLYRNRTGCLRLKMLLLYPNELKECRSKSFLDCSLVDRTDSNRSESACLIQTFGCVDLLPTELRPIKMKVNCNLTLSFRPLYTIITVYLSLNYIMTDNM